MKKKINTGLIFDTTTKTGNLSLTVNRQIVDSNILTEDISHSNILLDKILEIIIRNRIKKQQIDFIAFCRGPGNFTGIRIGAAIALGLSKAFNCSCFGVTKFQAYSSLLKNSEPGKMIIDGGFQNIYIKIFNPDQPTDNISLSQIKNTELDKTIFDNYDLFVIQESLIEKKLFDNVVNIPKQKKIIYASDNINHFINLFLSDLTLSGYTFSQNSLTPLYI